MYNRKLMVLAPIVTDAEGFYTCKLREDYPNEIFRCRYQAEPSKAQDVSNLVSDPPLMTWYVETSDTFLAIIEADQNYQVLYSEVIVNETI